MSTRCIGWAWVVSMAACNNESAVPADVGHSGTRLELGWFEFEDGMRTWSMDIRDRELDTPCVPATWTDGVVPSSWARASR